MRKGATSFSTVCQRKEDPSLIGTSSRICYNGSQHAANRADEEKIRKMGGAGLSSALSQGSVHPCSSHLERWPTGQLPLGLGLVVMLTLPS
jgi:hypothetical protein